MSSGEAVSHWTQKLIELAGQKALSYYTQQDFDLSHMKVSLSVMKQEYDRLVTGLEKKKIELDLRTQHLDCLRQRYEELEKREQCLDELNEVKLRNMRLSEQLNETRNTLEQERDLQYRETERELMETYEKSMKIFEKNPLVIKREELERKIARKKFDIMFTKQKCENLRKVNANIEKIKKHREQKEIIKIAEVMVKYYRRQKERSLNSTSKVSQEIVVVQTPPRMIINPPDPMSSQNVGNQKMPQIDLSQIQLPAMDMLTTNSFMSSKPAEQLKQISSNTQNTSLTKLDSLCLPKFEYNFQKVETLFETPQKMPISLQKQELKKPAETEKRIMEPKLSSTSKNNQILNNNTMEMEIEEPVVLSQPESLFASQRDSIVMPPSQALKKKLETNIPSNQLPNNETDPEPAKKIKIHSVQTFTPKSNILNMSLNQNIPHVQKSGTNELEKENRVEYPNQFPFLGQMFGNKTPSSTINEIVDTQSSIFNQSQQNVLMNPETVEIQNQTVQKSGTSELQKRNPIGYPNQMSSLGQMFGNKPTSSMNEMYNKQSSAAPRNVQQNIVMNSLTNEIQNQAVRQSNQFNLQPSTPGSAQNAKKSMQFLNTPNVPKNLETKSPYFSNCPSQEERSSLNTSTEQSDKVANVSSDQYPSQVSAPDSEGAVPNFAQGMEMGYGPGYDMSEFFTENPDLDTAMPEFVEVLSPLSCTDTNDNPDFPVFQPPPNQQTANQRANPFSLGFGGKSSHEEKNPGRDVPFNFASSSSKKSNPFNMF